MSHDNDDRDWSMMMVGCGSDSDWWWCKSLLLARAYSHGLFRLEIMDICGHTVEKRLSCTSW